MIPVHPRCSECELGFAEDEKVWLREDDTLVCDRCHSEDMRGDPYDEFDHGHPYHISIHAEECVRIIPVPKRAIQAEEVAAKVRAYEELTAKLQAAGVPATPSWPDAIDWLIRENARLKAELVVQSDGDCGCMTYCGDVAEADDSPTAICRMLP